MDSKEHPLIIGLLHSILGIPERAYDEEICQESYFYRDYVGQCAKRDRFSMLSCAVFI
jgi:hypothetical protein